MTNASSLPPLSPMGQLLYDIMDIIESSTRSIAEDRRKAIEAVDESLGEDSRDRALASVECSLSENTLTVRQL